MSFKEKSIYETNKKANIIGAFIRLKREEETMSLNFFSDIVKISKAYLSEIEYGKKFPKEYTLRQIFKCLDIEFQMDDSILNEIHEILFDIIYEDFFYLKLDQAQEKLKNIMNKSTYYENSIGFYSFHMIKILYYIEVLNDADLCEKSITIIRDNLPLFDKEELILYDYIAGYFYSTQKDFEKAYHYINQGLRSNPNEKMEALLNYQMARVLQMDGKMIKAFMYSEEAKHKFISLYCYKRVLYVNLLEANGYARIFCYQEAEKIYFDLLNQAELEKEYRLYHTVLAHICWIELQQRKFEECIKHTELCLSKTLEFEDVLLFKALCYLIQFDKEKCEREIHKIKIPLSSRYHILLDAMKRYCNGDMQSFFEEMDKYLECELDSESKLFINELLIDHASKQNDHNKVIAYQKNVIDIIKSRNS